MAPSGVSATVYDSLFEKMSDNHFTSSEWDGLKNSIKDHWSDGGQEGLDHFIREAASRAGWVVDLPVVEKWRGAIGYGLDEKSVHTVWVRSLLEEKVGDKGDSPKVLSEVDWDDLKDEISSVWDKGGLAGIRLFLSGCGGRWTIEGSLKTRIQTKLVDTNFIEAALLSGIAVYTPPPPPVPEPGPPEPPAVRPPAPPLPPAGRLAPVLPGGPLPRKPVVRLSLHLVDKSNKPISGAEVTFGGTATDGTAYSLLGKVTTDRNGRLKRAEFHPGKVTLHISKEGYQPVDQELEIRPKMTPEMTIDLQRLIDLEGEALFAEVKEILAQGKRSERGPPAVVEEAMVALREGEERLKAFLAKVAHPKTDSRQDRSLREEGEELLKRLLFGLAQLYEKQEKYDEAIAIYRQRSKEGFFRYLIAGDLEAKGDLVKGDKPAAVASRRKAYTEAIAEYRAYVDWHDRQGARLEGISVREEAEEAIARLQKALAAKRPNE
ncbi:MAG: carboxypeptidase regulatory-like domain-containing protein [Deltaproteobacteria bacterium]|nr:carboxypeptidase regulatory-like domain-containing protein [Deltaproteobacteria bacterium]